MTSGSVIDLSVAPIMTVENLTTVFHRGPATVRAVDDISFELLPSEVFGIVGESGSGKTMLARSLVRLLPPGAVTTDGKVLYGGQDLLRLPHSQMHAVRGVEIALIFQDPTSALNPVYTVGRQLREALTSHHKYSRSELKERAVQALADVGIPSPERRLDEYPHQFSGGMAQRVVIAIALASDPKVLLADEPTTALDVTTQHQILMLLLKIQRDRRMAMVLVSHSMGVIAQLSDRVGVMYAGQLVEIADTATLFSAPRHPYTVGVLSCVPDAAAARTGRLVPIPGVVPDLGDLPRGCRFSPRCPLAVDACTVDAIPLVPVGPTHVARCIRTEEVSMRRDLFVTGAAGGR